MFCALHDDVRFGALDKGRVQTDICVTVKCHLLHCVKSCGKGWATIRIDKVIATVNGRRNPFITVGRGHTKSDGKHNRITVRHDCDTHRFFGIMTVRHVDVVCERRACQRSPYGTHINQMMRNTEVFGSCSSEFQLLVVALAIIE